MFRQPGAIIVATEVHAGCEESIESGNALSPEDLDDIDRRPHPDVYEINETIEDEAIEPVGGEEPSATPRLVLGGVGSTLSLWIDRCPAPACPGKLPLAGAMADQVPVNESSEAVTVHHRVPW